MYLVAVVGLEERRLSNGMCKCWYLWYLWAMCHINSNMIAEIVVLSLSREVVAILLYEPARAESGCL
jgi:hypothetical protein